MKEKQNKNVGVISIIAVCLVLIIGLGTALFVTKNKTSSENKIEVSEENETEKKIQEFQERIDSGEESEVEVYWERVYYLIECDESEKYAKKILEDLIMIDNIEKTITSAANVMNYANYFNEVEIYDKYEEIFKERSKEEGYDENVESMG